MDVKGAHSNILEVLVVHDKTDNTDTSFTLPQVCANFPSYLKSVIYVDICLNWFFFD